VRVRDLEPQIRYDGPHLTKLDSKREMCFVACVCSGGGVRVRVCACACVRALGVVLDSRASSLIFDDVSLYCLSPPFVPATRRSRSMVESQVTR